MMNVEDVRHMKEQERVQRFLIDREWPRGVIRLIPHKEKGGETRRALAEIKWRPQLAPSAALWRWFQSNPHKIDRFRERYFEELAPKKGRWMPILQTSKKEETILLYQDRDLPLAPAHFFKEFLERQEKSGARTRVKVVELPVQGVSVPVEKSASRKLARPLRKEMDLSAQKLIGSSRKAGR